MKTITDFLMNLLNEKKMSVLRHNLMISLNFLKSYYFIIFIISLVIEFQPESKVAKTIDTGALPKILTSMLMKFREPNIELPEKMKIEVEIRGHACKFENIDV